MVVIGADVHKRTHTFVAVDEAGRELGHRTFEATTAGRQSAVMGAEAVRRGLRWAVEDCPHLSARLERDPPAAGQPVVRVPPKVMAEQRRIACTRGSPTRSTRPPSPAWRCASPACRPPRGAARRGGRTGPR